MPKISKTQMGRWASFTQRFRPSFRPRLTAPTLSLALLKKIGSTAMIGGMAIVIFAAFSMHSQIAHSLSEVGFHVRDVTLVGRYRTQRETILATLDIAAGSPILALDIEDKKYRLETLPWIKEARLVRRLPDLVHVDIVEYEPYAILERADHRYLIDRAGHKIIDQHLEAFNYLPRIRGLGGEFEAAHLLDLLDQYPVVRNRLVAASWVKGRRWTLHLDHGGDVLLPEGDMMAALEKLMALEEKQRVLAVARQTIDLRLADRILLRRDSDKGAKT